MENFAICVSFSGIFIKKLICGTVLWWTAWEAKCWMVKMNRESFCCFFQKSNASWIANKLLAKYVKQNCVVWSIVIFKMILCWKFYSNFDVILTVCVSRFAECSCQSRIVSKSMNICSRKELWLLRKISMHQNIPNWTFQTCMSSKPCNLCNQKA